MLIMRCNVELLVIFSDTAFLYGAYISLFVFNLFIFFDQSIKLQGNWWLVRLAIGQYLCFSTKYRVRLFLFIICNDIIYFQKQLYAFKPWNNMVYNVLCITNYCVYNKQPFAVIQGLRHELKLKCIYVASIRNWFWWWRIMFVEINLHLKFSDLLPDI